MEDVFEVTIRPAVPTDAEALTELAMRSKGFWGYEEAFLEACREDLTITAGYVAEHPVFVLEVQGHVAGFYSFLVHLEEPKLDFLYLDPEKIGNGFGRQIWAHLLETAKQMGVASFTIDADPYAEGFYQKMGAVRIGEIASTVFPGRMLPLLRVTL